MSRSLKPSIIARGLGFPESPRWRNGELWFVDGPTIKVWRPDGSLRVHAQLDTKILLGLDFFDDGSALVGAPVERHLCRVSKDGAVELYADLSQHFAHHTNEFVITPDEAVIVGTIGFDMTAGDTPQASRLLRIEPDRSIRQVGSEVFFSNAMVLADEGRTLYLSETMRPGITVYQVAADGSLDDGRAFADLTGRDASRPDGICLDPQGGVWYADVLVGAVVRVEDGGKELARISVPNTHAVACVFGGDRGDTLFVTATDAMPTPDLSFANVAVVLEIAGAAGAVGAHGQ
jgi:sugar lactone lactonase YvrE